MSVKKFSFDRTRGVYLTIYFCIDVLNVRTRSVTCAISAARVRPRMGDDEDDETGGFTRGTNRAAVWQIIVIHVAIGALFAWRYLPHWWEVKGD